MKTMATYLSLDCESEAKHNLSLFIRVRCLPTGFARSQATLNSGMLEDIIGVQSSECI
jgi:hypothetical protein